MRWRGDSAGRAYIKIAPIIEPLHISMVVNIFCRNTRTKMGLFSYFKTTCAEQSTGHFESPTPEHEVIGASRPSRMMKTRKTTPTSGAVQRWNCSGSCHRRLEELQFTVSGQARAARRVADEHEVHKARLQSKVLYLEKQVAAQKLETTELTSMIEDKDAELHRAESKITTLKKELSQRGAGLEKTYTKAISMLAQEVSREVPDDVIRHQLENFFSGELFSWCAEMCSSAVDEQRTLDALQRLNIFNGHLSLDFCKMGERASFVLLQAVLSSFLCAHFLSHAYFLAPEPHGLLAVESALAAKSLTEAVDWRVQTVQHLERICRYDATTLVRLFVTHFHFLLRDVGPEARKDLSAMISRFSQLSTTIWKVRSTVQIVGMSGFTKRIFMPGDNFAKCEAHLTSENGDLVIGRYIAAVLRPLIVSSPVSEPRCSVVWSKAVVWV
ncbi:CENP-Q, a CENPA-CAD centromere complex subunit domain-containing protein [Cordyceps javanica]|nr:CENP-Q, a CENPA-CAD centromere complex subunit domain-containing protein [Cordyceps javanica]